MVQREIRPPHRGFRFENAWCSEPTLRPFIENQWHHSAGEPFLHRLNACANALHVWGRELALRFRKQIRNKKQQMENHRDGTDPLSFEAYTKSRDELLLLLQQEETFWRQRAKHLWLVDGDLNTRYFHGVANGRHKRKQIDRLLDDAGNWQETNEELANTARSYFMALFTSQGSNPDPVTSAVSPMISSADNDALTKPFSKEEFRNALFAMDPNKAPGPDGFNPGFYQRFWDLIGDDVFSTCNSWLEQVHIPKAVRPTTIVLLPKKDVPESMRDLRPISLCNVLYRILAKTLANRFRRFIHKVIGEEQSAFVRDRSIVDNVLTAFESLHF
ncbi:Transposon TX1 uncharacterized 149 kDa protein [Linum grandiflorum]